jgi:cyclohexa-1,5-dienecarbonyl-CoA hydratase
MTKELQNIVLEREDGVAKITLNHPPVNIMDIPTMREINVALESLQDDEEIKAVLFGAMGKAFCAGVDVKDHTADKVDEMVEVFHRIFRLMWSLDVPTVAAVNGAALGGGCELVTFCDMVIASERATFGQPEIQVGVYPPVAAVMFPRLMPHTKRATLQGLTLGFEEALTLSEDLYLDQLMKTEDANEGLRAFMEKRKPVWKGK